MKKTIFEISKMDCPSEENLIRMKLSEYAKIAHLDFDISARKLVVFHSGEDDLIEQGLSELHLGEKKISSESTQQTRFSKDLHQKKLLYIVLAINAGFFAIEMTTGLLSRSMGLVADSLDMLADAIVYGLSLYAVGGTVIRKKRIAKAAGYFQLILAILGFAEVIRRFISSERIPDFTTMMVVSFFALIANTVCLYLLQNAKGKEEAHMKASMIFTSNDILINTGVIIAGALVYWFNSNLPDLIVGSLVFGLVIQGAMRILKLGK